MSRGAPVISEIDVIPSHNYVSQRTKFWTFFYFMSFFTSACMTMLTQCTTLQCLLQRSL